MKEINDTISKQVQSSVAPLAGLLYEVKTTIKEHIVADEKFQKESLERDIEMDKKLDKILHILLGDDDTGEKGLVGRQEKFEEQMAPMLDAWKAVKWLVGGLLAVAAVLGSITVIKNFIK